MRKYFVVASEMALWSQISAIERLRLGGSGSRIGLRRGVESDLDVLLVDALLGLGRAGQRALVGVEQRVGEEAPRPQPALPARR